MIDLEITLLNMVTRQLDSHMAFGIINVAQSPLLLSSLISASNQ